MRHLLSILTLLASVSSAFAGDIIKATLTVTNAANINATNAYTITVNADVRTWTNTVVNAATEIQASTNNATAAQRLLIHFATYQVTGLTPSQPSSTSIAWTGAEGAALTVTLSTNTWGSVSYTTNTVGAAVAVRVPYTVESATVRTNVANGLSDWLNLAANTTGISADKLLSGTVPLARISNLTTNQIAAAFYNWINSFSDTDDQTAAEVDFTPAGGLAATDVQAALEELDTEKEPALTDSASLRSTLSDESGTGAAIFADGAIGAATATTAAANDNDTSVATTAFVQTELTDLIDGGASWAGVQDFGGASDFEIPNGASPTVNTFGEIAGDNDLWAASRGAPVFYDGTAATALIGALVSDAPSNGQVPKWNTGGTITWEDDSTGAPGSGDDVFINGGAITHPDFDDSALDIIWTIVDSTNAVPSFARAAAIGSDPTLSANHATIGTTGIVFEGATADTIETLLTAEDPTASDKTLTLPNATDTLVGKATTDVFTNKTLDAAGTGNVLKQTKYLFLMRPDWGDGAGAIPSTNNYTATGLMHYTFSGNAETNANYVLYETIVPPDIDTSVDMKAVFGFKSGGTDTDTVTWHIAYGLGAAGAAYPATLTAAGTSPLAFAAVTPTTPAAGDYQATAELTLTGWAASMTAGTPLIISIRRLQDSNDDGQTDVFLRIAYGSTQ
jgi:hypothetical protein